MMRIDLERQEVIRASSCLQFVAQDPAEIGAWVRLYGDGHHRNWVAGNGIQLIHRQGEVDDREFQVLLTPGQIAFMMGAALADSAIHLEIDDEWVTVVTPMGNMSGVQKFGTHISDGFKVENIEEGAAGEFSARELITFLRSQEWALGQKHETDPTIRLSISENSIKTSVEVDHLGPSYASLVGENVTGSISLEVNLRLLLQVLESFDPTSVIHIGLPKFTKDPLVIRNEDTVALLMPLKTALVIAREHVEEVIEEQFGSLSLKRDSDGDYPLRRHGHLIYGHLLVDSAPTLLRVFGILLRDVEPSSDLLTEINQINGNSQFVKIYHRENLVVVSDDLVAESLDAVELTTSVSNIAKAIEDFSQTLSVVFGGVKEEDPAEIRWSRYRDTVVCAEFYPEKYSYLNGSDAVREWPFPGRVHVVSGWNPQGINVDGDLVNSHIAADVMRMGGKFVQGAGVSADGNYSEPSLIVWGLDREQMCEIARKASQDAIFELTAGEISLISSYSDRVETFTRFSNVGDHAVPESP
jgi:hypothetical protein